MASSTTTIIDSNVIINSGNTLNLNGDYIVSTNATLEIHDISDITLNGNKIILDGTTSSILFLGTSSDIHIIHLHRQGQQQPHCRCHVASCPLLAPPLPWKKRAALLQGGLLWR